MIVNKYKYGGGGSGSGSTYTAGEYIQIAEDVISVTGITPDLYLTTADTQDFVTEADITAATSPIQEQLDDIERVTATALTELNNDILEISGSTPDLSNYYTKAETDAEITGATQDFVTEADITAATSPIQEQLDDVERVTASALTELHQDIVELSGVTDMMQTKEEVIAAALVDLDERVEERVESQDVKHIVKLTQSAYNALVTKDPYTFYIIIN